MNFTTAPHVMIRLRINGAILHSPRGVHRDNMTLIHRLCTSIIISLLTTYKRHKVL
jgi:hypothetical protein